MKTDYKVAEYNIASGKLVKVFINVSLFKNHYLRADVYNSIYLSNFLKISYGVCIGNSFFIRYDSLTETIKNKIDFEDIMDNYEFMYLSENDKHYYRHTKKRPMYFRKKNIKFRYDAKTLIYALNDYMIEERFDDSDPQNKHFKFGKSEDVSKAIRKRLNNKN